MKLRCPSCLREYDIAAATKEQSLIEVIKMQADFAPHSKLVFEYAELFATTRPIKAAKLLRILTEVREIWTSGSFALQKTLYSISKEGMASALKTVCNKNLTALDGHNYLKKVMVTIAEQEAQKRSQNEERALKEKEARLRAGTRREDEQNSSPMPVGLKEKVDNILKRSPQ